MTSVLPLLMTKLMLASLSLTLAWAIAVLCFRLLKRPSVRLQVWMSWLTLGQTVLLGTITIPVIVRQPTPSPDPTPGVAVTRIEGVPHEFPTAQDGLQTFDRPYSIENRTATSVPSGTNQTAQFDAMFYVFTLGALIWCVGCGLVIGTWLIRYYQLVRYVQTCPDAPLEIASPWQALLSDMGLDRAMRVVVSDDIGPALCRLPREYVLLIPEQHWDSLDSDAQRAVLRHELAHYRCGHLWKMMLARCIACLHWFNPCGWWSVANLESAYECTADEEAVGDDALAACRFAQTLLELCPRQPANSPTLAAHGSDLKLRIERLIDQTENTESNMIRYFWISLACFLTLASVVRVEFVAAQDQPTQPEASVGQSDSPKPPSPMANRSATVDTQTFNYKLLGADPPAAYELAPGDRIHVVYEKENVDRDFVIPTDGSIELPNLATVRLTKLTMAEARHALSKLAAPNQIVLAFRDFRKVNVLVTRALDAVVHGNQQTVWVAHSVKLPAYENDVLHALIEKFGLPASPAWRIYIVRKPAGERLQIVAIDHRDRHVNQESVVLHDGDEVIVHKITKAQNEPIDVRGIGNFLMVVANGSWKGHSGDAPVPLLDGSFPITEILKLQDKTDIDKLPIKSVFQFPFLSAGKLTHTQRYFMTDGELTYDFTFHPKMLMPSLEQMADEMGVGTDYRDIVAGLFEDPKGPRINLSAVCNSYFDNRCQLIVENRWPQDDKPQQLAVVIRLKDSTALEEILSRLTKLEATGSSEKLQSTNVYSIHDVSYCVHQDQLIIGSRGLVTKLVSP